MRYSSEQASLILAEVHKLLGNSEAEDVKLRQVWRMMAYLRGCTLASLLRNTVGDRVQGGPFKDMQLIPAVLTGAFGPYLLGTYEYELHRVIEQVIRSPYKNILNIGCSFGYYAVGLAMLMPDTTMYAFDINDDAKRKCLAMAELNGVADRVKIGGLFDAREFETFADQETLVIMDIEGGELQMLDPATYPALQKMDVIVEFHDIFDPTISKTLTTRCAPSHAVEIILSGQPVPFDLHSITGPVGHIDPFDNMIVTWDDRDGPTPWGILKKRFNNS